MQISKNILIWLEKLLKSRFKLDLEIVQVKSSLLIKVKEYDVYVYISQIDPRFYDFSKEMPDCRKISAVGEGFKGIIEDDLYAPTSKLVQRPLFRKVSYNTCIFNYDILGLCYWCLNRLEEIGSDDLDEHGRFDGTKSHAFKFNYLDRPIVDEWLDILFQGFQMVGLPIKKYPKNPRISISHDVDVPSLYQYRSFLQLLRMGISTLVKRQSARDIVNLVRFYRSNKSGFKEFDPFNTFDWIMDVSDKNNTKSTFFFQCGISKAPIDCDYSLADPEITELIGRIVDRGHRLGLHPSYFAYENYNLSRDEFDFYKNYCGQNGIKLLKYAVRMHYLRISFNKTLSIFDDLGIEVDTTFGYPNLAGFRCGTCIPYTPFDPVRCEPFKVVMEPLILMEAAIISPNFNDLSEQALKRAVSLKEKCYKVGGNFSVLWHNSSLLNQKLKKFYVDILEM